MLALLKNDIQIFPIGLAAVGGNLREGKLTALAVATQQRVPMLPAVPTMEESGFPGFVASNWFGMAAPAGTPEEILDTLARAVSEAQQTALVKERFTALGMLVPELSRQQFAASLKSEAQMWQETVRRGNVTVEWANLFRCRCVGGAARTRPRHRRMASAALPAMPHLAISRRFLAAAAIERPHKWD